MTNASPFGIALVLSAGVLQGLFLVPMGHIRGWSWAQSWLVFAFFGMLLFNWLFALLAIPTLLSVYASAPVADLAILSLFGFGWGVGAILFSRSMMKLGLALGYPIIMGLIAAFGVLLPLLVFFPRDLVTARGLALLAGTAIVLVGIIICTRASTWKEPAAAASGTRSGIAMAVAAGLLSSLTNVGMAFGSRLIVSASGASARFANDSVWTIFFSAGFLANAFYCGPLVRREACNKDRQTFGRNLALTVLMSVLWIGSFYTYAAGAQSLGAIGAVIGWPLFIAVSIAVGNFAGLLKGEWRGSPTRARLELFGGLATLGAAVALIGGSAALP